jgi:hypothetical protein
VETKFGLIMTCPDPSFLLMSSEISSRDILIFSLRSFPLTIDTFGITQTVNQSIIQPFKQSILDEISKAFVVLEKVKTGDKKIVIIESVLIE